MGKPPGLPNELFTYERKKRHWTQGDVADKISAPDERMIRRWERGEVAPTPHYRGKLAEVFGNSARELGFPPDGQISFWHMPYRRNAFFTGREDILQLLRDTFLAQHASPVPRLPLALSGLGGVGKTQIALEYAYRYREHYHTVLWMHAASFQDLVVDVTAVADLLDLPGKDTANPEQLIEALKERLTQLTRWLLIFDNVENLQLLTGFLPSEIKGQLLLTTRSQNTGTHAHCITVESMDNNIGAELLLRRAKLIAIDSTLEHMAAADAAIARSLSEDMGGLPLALDQAGAYIEETAVSLSEYVNRYQEERRCLLGRRGSWVGDYSEHPEPVAVTFRLSFEKACERYPLASDMLHFSSFLQPDAIPEELFRHDDSFKYGTTVFDEAIAALLRYSLIKRNTEEQTCSIHRLVQAVLIDDMTLDLQKQWRERVVRALNAVFPKEAFTDLRQCERLQSHALACAAWTEDELSPTVGVAELIHKEVVYLSERKQYIVAEKLQKRALSIFEQHLGAEHPDTASALSNLGFLYYNRAENGQAEPLLVRALSIQEKQLGDEHLETVRIGQNLGILYIDQRRYEQAEPLLVRALSIHEKLLGTEHPDIARSLHSVAVLYIQQRRYEQAEPLLVRALSIHEKLLGTEHPDIARSLHMLAHLYLEQGKYKQADLLYQRAIRIWEKHLGKNFSGLPRQLQRSARLLEQQGEDQQAEALFRRALQSYDWLLESIHQNTFIIKMAYRFYQDRIGE